MKLASDGTIEGEAKECYCLDEDRRRAGPPSEGSGGETRLGGSSDVGRTRRRTLPACERANRADGVRAPLGNVVASPAGRNRAGGQIMQRPPPRKRCDMIIAERISIAACRSHTPSTPACINGLCPAVDGIRPQARPHALSHTLSSTVVHHRRPRCWHAQPGPRVLCKEWEPQPRHLAAICRSAPGGAPAMTGSVGLSAAAARTALCAAPVIAMQRRCAGRTEQARVRRALGPMQVAYRASRAAPWHPESLHR